MHWTKSWTNGVTRSVRYADDCNIYVRSRRAGERVMANVREFLEKKLRLKVNEQKSGWTARTGGNSSDSR